MSNLYQGMTHKQKWCANYPVDAAAEIERLTAELSRLRQHCHKISAEMSDQAAQDRIAKLEAALGKIVKYQPGSSDALNIATRALKNTEVTDE